VVAVLYGAQTPRRRDAQRNRSAIIQAASEAMTTQRPAVGMSEIARRAGVGQATLYRHFPDREALTAAVIGYQIQRLETLVAAGPGHPATFRRVLDEMLRTQITMRPLVFLVRRMDVRARRRFESRVIAVLAEPLRRAQEGGHVRVDLVPSDLALLFSMVEGVVEGADGVAAAQAAAGRSIDLALDGVFRPAASTTIT
jgi:AcrR family transcriptional regulator